MRPGSCGQAGARLALPPTPGCTQAATGQAGSASPGPSQQGGAQGGRSSRAVGVACRRGSGHADVIERLARGVGLRAAADNVLVARRSGRRLVRGVQACRKERGRGQTHRSASGG